MIWRNLKVRSFGLRQLHVHAARNSPPLAFAFDIDGVLLRGEASLPAARRVMRILDGNNVFGMKIPFIVITNGGGIGEKQRCSKLTSQLDYTIHPRQYIQAHTILRTMANKYDDRNVLVLGGKRDVVRRVAESYGFKHVFTPLDILAWNPGVWPFHSLLPAEKESVKDSVDFSNLPISAVFVFHDPRNWALDIQILCDIIQSGGIIGHPYVSREQQCSNAIELVFCNPDLEWRSDFPRPRLGQGAFKEAFQSVYKALTGQYYPYVQLGKPSAATYKFAETVLRDLLRNEGYSGPLPSVYMIGDNPESDIAGALNAGWESVLVETGIFDRMEGPPSHRPTFQAEDVEKAVLWALKRESER